MNKILAIDYGKKRSGLAYCEEPLNIAISINTFKTHELLPFLNKYIKENKVIKIIIGQPKTLSGSKTDSSKIIHDFYNNLAKKFTNIKIEMYDERFTSKIAQQTLISSGLKKNKRSNKELLDKISAVIILQDYIKSKESNYSSNK